MSTQETSSCSDGRANPGAPQEPLQLDEVQARLFQLQAANFQLRGHLHQASLISQSDKAALNNLQGQYTQLERVHAESEAQRAWMEGELHKERLDHQISKQTLFIECSCREETKKHIECIWMATNKIRDLLNRGTYADQYKTGGLRSNMKDERQAGLLDEEAALAARDRRISELGSLLQNTRTSEGGHRGGQKPAA
ncbi:MAG: hypothetical protein M1839_009295 [Geoglossum umbratile]|nr:MAG: hypothetical protein M1839_009295 [Geoglossum umbratile]